MQVLHWVSGRSDANVLGTDPQSAENQVVCVEVEDCAGTQEDRSAVGGKVEADDAVDLLESHY